MLDVGCHLAYVSLNSALAKPRLSQTSYSAGRHWDKITIFISHICSFPVLFSQVLCSCAAADVATTVARITAACPGWWVTKPSVVMSSLCRRGHGYNDGGGDDSNVEQNGCKNNGVQCVKLRHRHSVVAQESELFLVSFCCFWKVVRPCGTVLQHNNG